MHLWVAKLLTLYKASAPAELRAYIYQMMEMFSYAVDLLKDLVASAPAGFHVEDFFSRWSKKSIQPSETVLQQIYRVVGNFFTDTARILLTAIGYTDHYGSETSSTLTNNSWWNPTGLVTFKSAAADVFKSTILHSVAAVGLVVFLVSLWWRYKTHHKPEPEIQKQRDAVPFSPDYKAKPTDGADHDSDNSESEAYHTASPDPTDGADHDSDNSESEAYHTASSDSTDGADHDSDNSESEAYHTASPNPTEGADHDSDNSESEAYDTASPDPTDGADHDSDNNESEAFHTASPDPTDGADHDSDNNESEAFHTASPDPTDGADHNSDNNESEAFHTALPDPTDGADHDSDNNESEAFHKASPDPTDGADHDSDNNESEAFHTASPDPTDGADHDSDNNESEAFHTASPDPTDGADHDSDNNEAEAFHKASPDPTDGADHDSDNSESEAYHMASLASSDSVGSASFASAACSNSDRISPSSGSPSYYSSTSTDLCSTLPKRVRFSRKILIAPSFHLFSSSSSEASPDTDVTSSRSDSPPSSASQSPNVSSTWPELIENRDYRTIIHPENLSSSSSSAASLTLPLGPDYAEGMSISTGNYSLTVLEVLGRGTQATLYKVSDGSNTYAAKLCHAHTISLDILHEFEILAGLNHPNIVAVHQKIPRGFLMECLFQDLVTLIESTRYLAPPVRNRISVGILRGVNHIHMFGVAHLDIKPENILLTTSGEPKLADFGLAVKYLRDDGSWRHLESFRGTPQYVAPEMYSNEPILDLPKSDCWSVGVTLYAMMSGQPLFDGTTEEEIHFNQMHGRYSYPPFLSNISPTDTDYYGFMEMVKGLCRLDPGLRLTARQALCHDCL